MCNAQESSPHARMLYAISEECQRQDGKWGEQNHGDLYWLGIVTEELGELAQAIIQNRPYKDTQQELLHLAAVCVSWGECRLRHGGPAVALTSPQVSQFHVSR